MKAIHLARGQEAWGHRVARLLQDLQGAPADLIEIGRSLDAFLYPDALPGHPEGAPFERAVFAPSGEARRLVAPGLSIHARSQLVPSDRALAVGRASSRRGPTSSGASAARSCCGWGCFGSFARGDWGVGSDLDLVAVVRRAERPFIERARDWPLDEAPRRRRRYSSTPPRNCRSSPPGTPGSRASCARRRAGSSGETPSAIAPPSALTGLVRPVHPAWPSGVSSLHGTLPRVLPRGSRSLGACPSCSRDAAVRGPHSPLTLLPDVPSTPRSRRGHPASPARVPRLPHPAPSSAAATRSCACSAAAGWARSGRRST